MADKTLFEITEGSAPLLTDYALTGQDPAVSHVLRRTTWQSIKNLFMAGVTVQNDQAWAPLSATFNYVSPTSFTIAADTLGFIRAGDKLTIVQTTPKFFYVVSTSYSSPLTTVNVFAGSLYSLVSAPITSVTYSHAANPVNFPDWFPYTPTGIAASNVTLTGRFCVSGRTCKVQFKADFTGGITFTTMPTLPIAASASMLNFSVMPFKPVGYLDSGTAWIVSTLYMTIAPGATTFSLKSGNSDMSATSPITWANGDKIGVQFEYEI